MQQTHHKTSYKVRIADADAQAKLKIPSLFEMLQEVATEHAQILGVDFNALSPMGLSWALSKMSVELHRMPLWNERVYIDTWPSQRERIVTYREFSAIDAQNNPLFSARSQWVLFDLNTRRLARMERIAEFPRDEQNLATTEDFSELLLRPEANSPFVECYVRNNDIDLNGHVNNAIYVVWAIQALDDIFLKEKTPQKIQINFLEEVKPHEQVKSIYQIKEDMTFQSIVNATTNRESARINIKWI